MAANRQEAQESVLGIIKKIAELETVDDPREQAALQKHQSQTILALAEAFAWISNPNQSHGGGSSVTNPA